MVTSYDISRDFGLLRPCEIRVLKQLLHRLPAGAVVVNIGAGSGTSALAFAEEGADITLYSVDISSGGPLGGFEGERNAFARAGLLERLPLQILGDSAEIGRGWIGGAVDLVFVDGDHEAEHVRADIQAWKPHVKAGGYMLFHDYYNPQWPDVGPVVDEVMAGHKIVALIDFVIAFQL